MPGGSRARRWIRSVVLVAVTSSALLTAGWSTAPTAPAAAEVPAAAAAPHAPDLGTLPLPSHARVYFFGDSWTQGATAAAHRGFVDVTAASLKLTALRAPTGSGTGFTHVYKKAGRHRVLFARRAAALQPFTADLIVVQGGINDIGHSLKGYPTAIRRTITALRDKAGADVPVVVVGPAPFTFPLSDSARAVDRALADGAGPNRYHYVSPLREGWLNTRNARWFIDPVTKHPNTAGHAYFGARLTSSIRVLAGRNP